MISKLKVMMFPKLKKVNDYYQITIHKKDIKDYLVSGEENRIWIKQRQPINELFSKGPPVTIETPNDSGGAVIPHLYCISVGIL
jgi:hypothetical protein